MGNLIIGIHLYGNADLSGLALVYRFGPPVT